MLSGSVAISVSVPDRWPEPRLQQAGCARFTSSCHIQADLHRAHRGDQNMLLHSSLAVCMPSVAFVSTAAGIGNTCYVAPLQA